MRVCNEYNLCLITIFEVLYPVTFFVQQVSGHFNGQLSNNLGGAFLTRFFADNSENGERQRLGATDSAEAGAARAGLVGRFADRWS